jgi:hypothetical protein
MRLNRFLLKLKEEGEAGGITTGDVAQFAPKLTLASRSTRRRVRKIRKSKLFG